MKLNRFSAVLILSFLITPVLHAEPGAELAAPADLTTAPAGNFEMIVKGDGKLTIKPGPVFTEGVEAEGVSLPYLISGHKTIRYPRWAVRQGWQGKLVLAIEVKPDGTVGRYSVMRSTGHRLLDESGTKAVLDWKFQPALQNGKPILTCVQIPVVFQLDL